MTVDITLERLALGGDAVGRHVPPAADAPAKPGGQVVFVPHGAPGDRVHLEDLKSHGGYARARLAEVLSPSPERTDPACPLFFRPGRAPLDVCGGCDWQHLRYDFQKTSKRTLLTEAFERLGKIPRPNVEPTLGPDGDEQAWRYRNKVQIPFAMAGGQLVGGFYAPASHTVVPLEDCGIQNELSLRVFRAVRDWFRQHPVPVFDRATGQGWLRHLLIRTNSAGQALAGVVTGPGPVPLREAFIAHLGRECPALISLHQNINTREDNVVLGPRWVHLHGRTYLPEKVLGVKLKLSPGAFFQVNHAMAEKLYAKVRTWADPTPEETVVELYAGVGAMGLLLAARSKFVWGIEENPHAVQDADAGASMNRVKNIRFLTGKCEAVLARGHFRDQFKSPAAVILDPPRAGCGEKVLRAVMRLSPRRIVYVSCDPGTLARDARYLATGGYHLKRSVAVDLFPQTSHIESVSLFSRPTPAGPPSR